MKNVINRLESSKAAVLVGASFIASVILVTLVDDLLLPNFVVPGDTEALARDLAADRDRFFPAALGYLLVLALDTVIGLALYVVLKPASPKLAWLTAALRLSYVAVLVTGVLALGLEAVDVYGYATVKLFGYVLFALHLLCLGYAVFRSEYMPKTLGAFVMFGATTYTIFFIEFKPPEAVAILMMLIMLLAELSLSIWLLAKRHALPHQQRTG